MFGSMYGAVLALISCAGAWVAWRRHPLYSPGATFRILAETLLLLIAAAAAIATTVHLTENKSVTVQMIALFSVIVLVTLAMIFSITAISTPKSAHLSTTLPPTVTLVKAAVTGNGRADKNQVTAMVRRLLRITDPPRPADAADALALAICQIWRGGGNNLRLSAVSASQALASKGGRA